MQQRNEMIAHLKDQLQEMKAKTSMEGKYIKKDAEVKFVALLLIMITNSVSNCFVVKWFKKIERLSLHKGQLRLGVFLLPLEIGIILVHCRVTPSIKFHVNHSYIHLGGERQCKSKEVTMPPLILGSHFFK